MADRSFTDEELALIIGRAARIHESTSESRHSLADVQQIAEQVGIPPEIVAAVAMTSHDVAPKVAFCACCADHQGVSSRL